MELYREINSKRLIIFSSIAYIVVLAFGLLRIDLSSPNFFKLLFVVGFLSLIPALLIRDNQISSYVKWVLLVVYMFTFLFIVVKNMNDSTRIYHEYRQKNLQKK